MERTFSLSSNLKNPRPSPKGRKKTMNPSPEGVEQCAASCETGEQFLELLLKLREHAHQGPGKYHPPVEPDITDLPELPAHWTWASPSQLSSAARHALAIGPFGSNLKVSDYQDEGVPLVFVRNIRSEAYADGTKFVSESKAKELGSHTVDPGDILVTKMGEPPGDSSIYPIGAPKAVITADCIKWRVAPDLSPKFFMYALRAETTKRQIATRTRGVAQKKVSLERFRDLALPLPPLPEQRRIVARIEELFSRLAAGVAALRHAKAQLKRYRQSVLAAAVTGQLTQAWREQHPDTESAEELLERILKQRREQWNGRGKYTEPVPANEDYFRNPPATWEMASMDALTCHITSGSRDWTKYYKVDGYAVFVMAQNVRPLKFDSTPVIRVAPPDGDRDKIRSAVARDDLLVTIVGANTGNVCRVDKSFEDYYVCQSVALMRPVESATAKYLDLYMNSEEHGQDQFDKWMYGQGRPHLSFDQLRSTAVFLPTLAEQHQIVAEVEARTTAIDHLEAELDRQITRSNRLRQSSLAAAFSGDI